MNQMPDWYIFVRLPLLFVQSLIGTLLFSYPLRRRRFFAVRFAVGLCACLVLTERVRALWTLQFNTLEIGIGRFTCILLVYLLLVLMTWFCYEESIWTALFVASSGYSVQDIGGSIKTMLKVFPVTGYLAGDPLGVLPMDLLCYGGVYLLLFKIFQPFVRHRNENFDNKIKAAFSFIILLLCIGMARMTQDNLGRNAMAQISESIYAIMCDVLILLLQFGVMEQAKLSHNVDQMRHMLQKQQDQYEASKSSMDLVNEKYHDLKALLRGFRGQISPAQMQKLENRVQEYDLYLHTGNAALDVILTERRALCARRGIQFTCLIQGKDLSFMEELDLYTLFGNALDNAIEAVSQLPEGENKFISLTSQREDNMITVHIENPFSGKLEFSGGLPSSKRDSRYHGFGLRSMERIVHEYGGALAVQQRGNIFCLDLLLMTSAAKRPASGQS